MLIGQPRTPIRGVPSRTPSAHNSPYTPSRLTSNNTSTTTSSHAGDTDDDRRKRRKSFFEERLRRQSGGGLSGASTPLRKTPGRSGPGTPRTPGRPRLSEEELKRSFEEWMKIAADNKINANNSWNLALIDYFHDMTLLREGDSINFQKASCTLDGCVKIYTSRVDSVDSETKKLLSGLVETHSRNSQEDGADADDDEGEDEAKPKRKRATRSGNTLEKDIANLNVKKFDLEFNVDPLFKKTSADFDEGGAHGLLLNHLSISRDGKIIFDGSDSSAGAAAASDNAVGNESEEVSPMSMEKLDISGLKARFAESLKTIWDKEICPSLKGFEFSSSTTSWMPSFTETSAFDDPFANIGSYDDVSDDDPDSFGDAYPEGDHAAMGAGDVSMMSGVGDGTGEMANPFADPEVVLAMNHTEDSVFSYFDTAMMRGWAGPEFWRSKPLAKTKDAKDAAATAAKRKRKPEFVLDFVDAPPVNPAALFAPATASITLPKPNERTKSTHLLPDDMHFSSKDFLKLFLKPEHKIKFMRRDGKAVHSQDGPIDEQFWAEHEVENGDNRPVAGDEAVPGEFPDLYDSDSDDDAEEEDMSSLIVPIANASGNLNSSGMMMMNATMDYGDHLVDQPKKVRAVPLNFARVAKKVDVRKLKENIWRGLIGTDEDGEDNNPMNPRHDRPPVQLTQPKRFTEVVHSLDGVYSEKKRKDISVAFCFICVLHLANEQGLVIQGSEKLDELVIAKDG
ncbi:hypothetical protein HDU85_004602 [Gaertneriomyces sp. JEL0708]|nr:hypothetical protein HDU85_004602 [Gaertneriomyces sp. JEL0708]